MTHGLEQLVVEASQLTGAAPPALLSDDAPVLAPDSATSEDSVYLVGIIGGKDVGKSSLVNSLVGEQITAPTSHGPGTEDAIAYVHESSVDQVKEALDRELPGRLKLITHRNDALRRQVLLDLPDVDSKYTDHVQLTRRMLRHILYPIWIQSIEKYADLQPQRLLAQVAEGNDPANFVFCLNKIDQLHAGNGNALRELQDDYAQRLARTLALPDRPDVFLISAVHPADADLPALRKLLSREKPVRGVKHALDLAARRKSRSLLAWLDEQNLPEHSQRLERLQHEAEELLADRVAGPLLEQGIPRLLDDPGFRLEVLEAATRKRLSRWPIVNILDVTFAPLMGLIRKNLSAGAERDGRGLEDLSPRICTTFAQLHQSHPLIGELYEQQKLWDDAPAWAAAGELRSRIDATLDRLREAVVAQAAGKSGIIRPIFRWLLTIGALLWFPFIQPILQAMLEPGMGKTTRELLFLAVQVAGVTYLLKNVTFLIIWFVALWLLLRWSTQRRVSRLMERWKTGDDESSPTGQTLQWIDELVEPIRRRREQAESIVQRVEQLRGQVMSPESLEPAAA